MVADVPIVAEFVQSKLDLLAFEHILRRTAAIGSMMTVSVGTWACGCVVITVTSV